MAIGFHVEGMRELKQLLADMSEEGRPAALEGIHNWLDYTFEVAQNNVPTDKGGLGLSGDVIKNQNGGAIVYTAPYARFVHFGFTIKKWSIKPRRRKALRWEAGRKARLEAGKPRKKAQWVFAKKSPGRTIRVKPQPWLFNAVDATFKFIGDFIFQEFDKKIGA